MFDLAVLNGMVVSAAAVNRVSLGISGGRIAAILLPGERIRPSAPAMLAIFISSRPPGFVIAV
jgi:hypothetical protein